MARREQGVLGLSPTAESLLRWGARAWTFAVLVAFGVLAIAVGFPRDLRSDGMLGTIELPVQLAMLVIGAVGWAVAWRRESVGALTYVLIGATLCALSLQLHPPAVSAVVLIGFLIPAVAYWALWQHTRSRRAIASFAIVTAVALVAGAAGVGVAYARMYGPTHPESSTVALPIDQVGWVWSGAVTETSFRVNARVDTDAAQQAELVVQEAGSTQSRSIGPVPVPDNGIVTWTVSDLRPDTPYDYVVTVDGHADQARGRGSAQTFPRGPASFTIAVGADARTGSNGAVFDAIRATEPLLYINTGDLHYGNVDVDDIRLFRARYDDVLTSPAQSALYRSTPVAYVWDDHDYGADNADAGSPSRRAARLAYREHVPHYDLPAGAGDAAIYQAFTVGRVRFVLIDTRSERTAESMLGDRQLRWLTQELVTSSRSHELVVWVSSVPWIAPADPGRDDWGGYPAERQQIAEAIDDAGVENLVMLAGDAHMVAIDDGSNSGYGRSGRGFPVLQAAALDRPGTVKGGPYSHGVIPGGGQFGTLTVHDDNGPVVAEIAGLDWTGRVLMSHAFSVS
jgi:phosphodiesterase/alkaline phosphatase D-like protein